MPAERYFVDTPFAIGKMCFLEEEEFHHLRVLRIGVKERVELINGQNQLAIASVEKLHKNTAELLIETIETSTPKHRIILAQALPRFNRLEFIVEKATELGATAIWLFPAEGSEKKTLSEQQAKRLRHLCIAALKQCGRLDLPEIVLKPPLADWGPQEGKIYFGDLRASQFPTHHSNLLFFIGPEKGFSEKETAFLENRLRAQGVKLHDNTLRVDTAALAALALAT